MGRKNTRSARTKDKLRKQAKRAEIQQSFVYQAHTNEWKNEIINRLQIPSQLLGTTNQNAIEPLPLTPPTAVHPIIGDGNCLFSALSFVLTGTAKHYQHIRMSVCNLMKTDPNDITPMLPTNAANAQSYLKTSQMEINGTWGTEIEITTAAVLLQTNIYVYSKHGVHWKWIKHSPSHLHTNHGIYLYHKDENHFEVVVAVENSKVPSYLSPDQYYCPQTKSQTLKRTKKREADKERYNNDVKFKKRKIETQKRSYNSDENVRTKKLKLQKEKYTHDKEETARKLISLKDRYKRDNNYKTKKIQSLNDRYKRDSNYKTKKIQSLSDRYKRDGNYKTKKIQSLKERYHRDTNVKNRRKQYEKDRYDLDTAFRTQKLQSQKQRYASDPIFSTAKKQNTKQLYDKNQLYKQKKIISSIRKYSSDSLFRNKLRQFSKLKYLKNSYHRQKVKIFSKRKYSENREHRQKVKENSKRKYSGNLEHRQKVKDNSKRKYSENPGHRQKVKEYSKQKYSENRVHREKVKAYSKSKYQRLSCFRNTVKAASIKKYATNPLFRHSLKCYLRRTYHQSNLQKHKKKARVAASRRSVTKSIRSFKRTVNDSPKYICRVCIRLLYRNQVKLCKEKRYFEKDGDKLNEVAEKCFTATDSHICDDNDCPQSCYMKMLNENKNWICHTCDRHLRQGAMQPQAQANNLFLIPVPEELSKLNVLERQLIALRIPFMKLLSLPRGGQKGVKGPVVNVPSDIATVTTSLPRNLNDAQLVKVKLKRKLSYKGHYSYQWISPSDVIEALKKLKSSNIWYENIDIDESWIESITDSELVKKDPNDSDSDSDDDNDQKETPENAEPTATLPNSESTQSSDNNYNLPVETCFQPIDMGQDILDANKTLCIAPAEDQKPQNIFQENGSDAMAFPTLLPDGHFGLFDNREVKLTPSKYFNARLFSADSRFATNKEFIFFAQYVLEINSISSNISLALRKGKEATSDGKPVAASMLLDSENIGNILKSDIGYRFLQPVRVTPPYCRGQ